MADTIAGVLKIRFQQMKSHGRYGRSGLLHTRRGPVATPFFMPVATKGAAKGLTPGEVSATGAPVLLSNTYHLHLQPGEKLIKKAGGLHQFTRWEGPILTDSGGFQVFSLAHTRKISEEGVTFKDPATGAKVFISPEKSIQIQLDLGSDIIMAFDDLTGLAEETRQRAPEAVERTHRWLERCIVEFNKRTKGLGESQRPLLFGIVQGGLDKRLRRQSLDFTQSTPVDGIAVGGLAVGESRSEMYQILDFLAPFYDPARPHYLMGIGAPADLKYAIEKGIDMTDSVMPTRNGRHGSAWIGKNKKVNLKNAVFAADLKPLEKGCDCLSCQGGYSRGLLRHLFKVGDPLAGRLTSIHNLRYLQRICETYH
jgi:queuine tRNA-ribosyltransferase